MPRSNLPEQMRMKAMRSRWALFMLAWILKIKAEKSSRAGSMRSPVRLSTRASGVGVRRRNSLRNGSTPKLVSADPKKTGDSSPRSTRPRSNSSAAPSSSSISSDSWLCSAGVSSASRRSSPSSASISSTIFTPLARPSLWKASTLRLSRSNTPLNALPQPMGQFMG
jgi:hypothetical protein